jgi:hypothetical protein
MQFRDRDNSFKDLNGNGAFFAASPRKGVDAQQEKRIRDEGYSAGYADGQKSNAAREQQIHEVAYQSGYQYGWGVGNQAGYQSGYQAGYPYGYGYAQGQSDAPGWFWEWLRVPLGYAGLLVCGAGLMLLIQNVQQEMQPTEAPASHVQHLARH